MKKYDYDLIVIGGGAAGVAGALMAASQKKKVAIIERDLIGGQNTIISYTQQVASRISQLLFRAREGASFGLNSDHLKINLPSMYSEIQSKAETYIELKRAELEEARVEIIRSNARFISPIEVAIENGTITSRKFLIATGTSLSTGEITGLDEVGFLTPGEIYLGLPRIPKVVLVVGAGQSGIETAEFLANMGSSVILVEMTERILPKEDPEVAKIIEAKLGKKKKIKILTETKVLALENDGVQTLPTGRKTKVVKAILSRGEQRKSVRVECVVLATGQKPETELGLENANVSKTVVENNGFVRMTNIYPKVASVGMTEDQCILAGVKYTAAISGLTQKTAIWSPNAEDGFVKILCNHEKKILGATIVAPDADILMQEISLAMRNKLSVVDIAAAPHVGMSLSEAIRVTARKLL